MIRFADLKDFDRIMEMMIDFANSSPYKAHHNPQYNDRHVRTLLTHIMQNGVILVGEIEGELQGMLIGIVNSDPWLPEIKTMREIAWWVAEDYRMTTLGYKLLKKYIEVGKELQHKEKINGFTLTLMQKSPDLDLESRGWNKVERNYMFEG
tara:strand:- start:10192 stop:10644 length:453 start_codon:yes stop_codon:yes gene_type:complete